MNKPFIVASVVFALFSFTALALALWSAYRIMQIQKTLDSSLDSRHPSTGTPRALDNDPASLIHSEPDANPIPPKTMPSGKYARTTLGDLSVNRQSYHGQRIEIIDYMDTGPLPLPDGTRKPAEYMKILSPDYVRGLDLVHPPFTSDDPNRYVRLAPLFRGQQLVSIKGTFKIDLMKTPTRPIENDVIVVDSLDVLPFPQPEERIITKEGFLQMVADHTVASLNRKRITYEGEYGSGFEVSLLDNLIWANFVESEGGNAATELERFMHSRSEMKKEDGQVKVRIRATGVIYTTPGQRYGHLGRASYQMMIDMVTFLGD